MLTGILHAPHLEPARRPPPRLRPRRQRRPRRHPLRRPDPVLFGRCLHRGALLSDGHVRGDDLIRGVHNWDYGYDTGASSYNPEEALHKFGAWIDPDPGAVFVDEAEVAAWHDEFPQAYSRDEYLGLYADVHGTPEEPHNHYIQELARNGRARLQVHASAQQRANYLNATVELMKILARACGHDDLSRFSVRDLTT